MNWKELAELIRSLVRPTVTWMLVIAAISFAAVEATRTGKVPEWFVALPLLALNFYFLDRIYTKLNSK